VPLLYAYSDGPRTIDDVPAVAQVRDMLHAIDWCEVVLHEQETNLGLGRSILEGVTEVLGIHESVIVFEDDLICVPGTYEYLCAALEHYRDVDHVMSVTGWTHPRVTPDDVTDMPYFDGRAECWVWGTWARAWKNGMGQTAQAMVKTCLENGLDVYRYGADLPEMARVEIKRNIWAVRFLYHHILNGGMCLRPPSSMVEHAGFDSLGTNATNGAIWANPGLKEFAPPVPSHWPDPIEHPQCPILWQKACGGRPPPITVTEIFVNTASRLYRYMRSKLSKLVKLGKGKQCLC
jgi:hypothetical protein